jgi:hypothetical protein
MMADAPKYMRWGFWPRHGLFMVRLFGKFYRLRAPWSEPLFSERMGLDPVIHLGWGWRITIRKVK